MDLVIVDGPNLLTVHLVCLAPWRGRLPPPLRELAGGRQHDVEISPRLRELVARLTAAARMV